MWRPAARNENNISSGNVHDAKYLITNYLDFYFFGRNIGYPGIIS